MLLKYYNLIWVRANLNCIKRMQRINQCASAVCMCFERARLPLNELFKGKIDVTLGILIKWSNAEYAKASLIWECSTRTIHSIVLNAYTPHHKMLPQNWALWVEWLVKWQSCIHLRDCQKQMCNKCMWLWLERMNKWCSWMRVFQIDRKYTLYSAF